MPLCDLEGNPIPDDRCPIHPTVTGECDSCERLLRLQLGTAVPTIHRQAGPR